MKLIRYSMEGFKPQRQKYHFREIIYELHNFNINDYPEHLRREIQQTHDKKVVFYKQHFDDFKYGIWCFVDGYKNNQSLNHLKHKVPCFEAECPDNIECYDCNWEKLLTISDPIVTYFGCYIPKREVERIFNIKIRRRIII